MLASRRICLSPSLLRPSSQTLQMYLRVDGRSPDTPAWRAAARIPNNGPLARAESVLMLRRCLSRGLGAQIQCSRRYAAAMKRFTEKADRTTSEEPSRVHKQVAQLENQANDCVGGSLHRGRLYSHLVGRQKSSPTASGWQVVPSGHERYPSMTV